DNKYLKDRKKCLEALLKVYDAEKALLRDVFEELVSPMIPMIERTT
ncbi:unnamed protein product, partial [marine sediment metagenome]